MNILHTRNKLKWTFKFGKNLNIIKNQTVINIKDTR